VSGTAPDDRAQVFTLEAVFAALVVVAGLVFALQAVVLTPSTSGAAEQPTSEAQLNSALTNAAERGTLRDAVLFWNPNGNGFHGSTTTGPDGDTYKYYLREAFVADGSTPNPALLDTIETLVGEGERFNVLVHYRKTDGTIGTQRLVDQGAPGQNSVRASATVLVYDDDRLRTNTGAPSGTTVSSAASTSGEEFYAPDIATSGDEDALFNVFEVEVVVW
jgi:hypothetical protein